MSLSPDGKTIWVVGGSPDQVNEYNAATAAPTGITYPTAAYPVGVASRGKYLATVSLQSISSNNVWLFDAGTPTPVWLGHVADGVDGPIRAGIALSGDSTRLYVVSGNSTLNIFQIAPGSPSGVSAVAGAGKATVSWTAPLPGGSPITGYTVTPYLGGVAQPAHTYNATSTSAIVTGLSPGSTYTFKVAATNALGTGTPSAASSPLLIPVPPSAPTIGSATAVGSGQVDLTWSAPSSIGGAPITGYQIIPSVNGTPVTTFVFHSPATSQAITGLTNGVPYTFTVWGINVAGTGPSSASSNVVTTHASPNDRFVMAAYTDFLGRPPSVTELDDRSTALGGGAISRGEVVSSLAASTDWVYAVVNQLYVNTLGRPGDSRGVHYWATKLQSGSMTVAQVAANFYASPEYFAGIGGGTVSSWLTDLYAKLLGRVPYSSGLAYWTGLVASSSRLSVAFSFYQSSESCHARVAVLYEKLLGRSPEPGGWDYWAKAVAASGDIKLAASLAASDEYFTRAQARFS